MKYNLKKLIITMFLFIIVIYSVSAIGIGPVKTEITFEPNLKQEITFKIYNNDAKYFTTSVKVKDDLEQYVNFTEKEIEFTPEKEFEVIKIPLKLPRDMPPGKYKSTIQIIEKTNTEGIGAQVAVNHDIILTVPAHGKYIRETTSIIEDKLITKIENIGVQTIEKLEVESKLYHNNTIIEKNDKKSNLKKDEIFEIVLPLEIINGEYNHNLTINYDGLTKNTKKSVLLGEPKIEFVELKTEDFILGRINQIKAKINTNWNKKLEDVSFEILLKKAGKTIKEIKTEEFDLMTESEINLFLDTENLDIGYYNFEIKSIQKDKIISEKTLDITIYEKSIKIEKRSKKNAITSLIISLSIGILAFLILKFGINKRRKKLLKRRQKKGKTEKFK